MAELLDENGRLIGATGLRKVDLGDSNEWEIESVTGWVVYGNKFVISMEDIEIALSLEAVDNIYQAIMEKVTNKVTAVEGTPV